MPNRTINVYIDDSHYGSVCVIMYVPKCIDKLNKIWIEYSGWNDNASLDFTVCIDVWWQHKHSRSLTMLHWNPLLVLMCDHKYVSFLAPFALWEKVLLVGEFNKYDKVSKYVCLVNTKYMLEFYTSKTIKKHKFVLEKL